MINIHLQQYVHHLLQVHGKPVRVSNSQINLGKINLLKMKKNKKKG